jgi:hypothetical protein
MGYSGRIDPQGLPEYTIYVVNSEESPPVYYRLTSASGETLERNLSTLQPPNMPAQRALPDHEAAESEH